MFDMKNKPKKMKLSSKQMDLDSLDELISMCEDSMVKPFSKKKVLAVEVEPKESEDEMEMESEDEKPDFEDMDLEDLLKMYQEMQEDKE